ncbi:TIGR02281 family clan AA aspartic protease [Bowmanella sp. Y57]|uniref:TIGR02281 family clan AA aspartic protease n=2 Tax=Bowmanella yangjiangensis TaxID=2811230 RepID=A0ABS3CMD1_9ALTE|nr:TIGR02281 family clan AA aspartic protease [Bowmanella yangjiangensis]
MWILTWVSAIGLLTLLFDKQLARQFNPNEAPSSVVQGNQTSVKLKRNRQGHYVTSGLINGEPVVFLLDTGATQVSVPSHLAQKLGLKAGQRFLVSTANGRIEVASTQLDSVQIGNIELRNISANINPGMQSDEILLGMSALNQLEFSQSGDVLTLTYSF